MLACLSCLSCFVSSRSLCATPPVPLPHLLEARILLRKAEGLGVEDSIVDNTDTALLVSVLPMCCDGVRQRPCGAGLAALGCRAGSGFLNDVALREDTAMSQNGPFSFARTSYHTALPGPYLAHVDKDLGCLPFEARFQHPARLWSTKKER